MNPLEPVPKVSYEVAADKRYAAFNIANLMAVQQRERVLASMLAKEGLTDLFGLEILDVGCGSGGLFLRLMSWGATARALHGIDVQAARVSRARTIHPEIEVVEGNAAALPWPDGTFDMITQFTTFTSINDSSVRRTAAQQVDRVLKPAGFLVWYDFWLNPSNRLTHPIAKKELKGMFPGYRQEIRRVTLAPPVARVIAPRSHFLASLLEEIWVLRSHLLAILIKPK